MGVSVIAYFVDSIASCADDEIYNCFSFLYDLKLTIDIYFIHSVLVVVVVDLEEAVVVLLLLNVLLSRLAVPHLSQQLNNHALVAAACSPVSDPPSHKAWHSVPDPLLLIVLLVLRRVP